MGLVAVSHVNGGTGSKARKDPAFRSNRLGVDGRRRVEGFGGSDGDDDGNGGAVVVGVERQRRRAINNDRIPSIAVSNRGR